jgi:site-specific DNA-cytosine methylase
MAEDKLKLLELFSGRGSISKAFIANGGEAYRVDWSNKVEADLYADVSCLTTQDVIKLCGGVPDFIWASPQCTTYSIATHRHRTVKEGLVPKTDLAEHDDQVNVLMWNLIDELIGMGTKYYFVENPMGRMRHMPFVQGKNRHTITYCSYGNKGNANGYLDQYIKKPTDIWTNHPNPLFLPQCKTKTKTHKHGDWGMAKKSNHLSRGEMPQALTTHIANILTSKRGGTN